MPLAIASDLHVEFDEALLRAAGRARTDARVTEWARRLSERDGGRHPRLGPDLDAALGTELLILAGDVAQGRAAVEYAAEAAAYCSCPVALVPGNHEYYGLNLQEALADMRALAAGSRGRVHLLDRDRLDVTIDGRQTAILGCTLWTDYELMGEDRRADSRRAAEKGLNDHRAIRFGPANRSFRPNDALALHTEARKWLAQQVPLARAEAEIVVVVTHHAPTIEAIPPRYRASELSPAFASDMGEEIALWQPDLWICGHTHHSFEARGGQCRVIGAQRGYVGAEESAWGFVPRVERCNQMPPSGIGGAADLRYTGMD